MADYACGREKTTGNKGESGQSRLGDFGYHKGVIDGHQRPLGLKCYSVRSAFTGLMEAALRAGMTLAINALNPSAKIDPLSTTGSQPFT